MPKSTIVRLLDDLDGKELPEDTAPVTLSLGRTTYNLYLSDDNHGKLLKALDPYITDAETVSASAATSRKSSTSTTDSLFSTLSADDKAAMRHWAHDTKHKVNDKELPGRGRVPNEFVTAWQDAGSPGIPS